MLGGKYLYATNGRQIIQIDNARSWEYRIQ